MITTDFLTATTVIYRIPRNITWDIAVQMARDAYGYPASIIGRPRVEWDAEAWFVTIVHD